MYQACILALEETLADTPDFIAYFRLCTDRIWALGD